MQVGQSETTPNHLCSAAFISSAAMNGNVNYGLQESRLRVNQKGLPRARSRFYCSRIIFLTFSFLKFFYGSKFFCETWENKIYMKYDAIEGFSVKPKRKRLPVREILIP
jgi:hypothetical protein